MLSVKEKNGTDKKETNMEKVIDALLEEEISGYCRISVDEELDKDNTSIENQKSIIEDFVKKKFPKCTET